MKSGLLLPTFPSPQNCLCSRGMAGTLKADWLEERKDVNGSTFLEAGQSVGLDSKTHKVCSRSKS